MCFDFLIFTGMICQKVFMNSKKRSIASRQTSLEYPIELSCSCQIHDDKHQD